MRKNNNALPKTVAKKKKPTGIKKNEPTGAPASEQDPKRRLGNFSAAGDPPRRGSRTAGIVGQTKKKNHTDKQS